MSQKKEFGDFQTHLDLADEVTELVAELFPSPDLIVEPTAGLGTFLKAAFAKWKKGCQYEGYEINEEYVKSAKKDLAGCGVRLFRKDFFEVDWSKVLNRADAQKVLVIGNPPWVTNAGLGVLGSANLPKKSNIQGLRGLDAKTGKSNFDIAEWMLIRLIDSLPKEGAVAVLCKTMTARKVLKHFWKLKRGTDGASIFRIDAKKSFDVAVDACLFFVTGRESKNMTATVYDKLDLQSESSRFGFVDGDLVSNVDDYMAYCEFDGGSAYTWRSGLKHDASRVMELTPVESGFENGFGETLDLEPEYVYPLLKSSDLGNGRIKARKFVIVPQQRTGDDTSVIKIKAPKTWEYLNRHSAILDNRKSSIYLKRPRFSIFGIGEYSFAKWKVGISGLYKTLLFSVIPPVKGRSVMIDDTCYSIPCGTEEEARLICKLLNSEAAQSFLKSLIFTDSKRPVTVDVLKRISIVAVANYYKQYEELKNCVDSLEKIGLEDGLQMEFLMEKPPVKYQTKSKTSVPTQ